MAEADPPRPDVWVNPDAYEAYMGRWSRVVAREFVNWLDVPPSNRWLDVGCGTGALTAAILEAASPIEVVGVEPSESYLEQARQRVSDKRLQFVSGDAQRIPVGRGAFDVAVAGLVLNLVSDPSSGVAEMVRAVDRGGLVGAYVWDYAGEMQMLRRFWDAAVALDPRAAELDEGRRFPIRNPDALAELFEGVGLREIVVEPIDVKTRFRDFDDYWSPFLGGDGPAPGYAASLDEERRRALAERLRQSLPAGSDGSIDLVARAWAVRGRK